MECIYDLSLLQEPNRRNKVKEIVSKFVECGNKRIEGYNKQFPKIDKEYFPNTIKFEKDLKTRRK